MRSRISVLVALLAVVCIVSSSGCLGIGSPTAPSGAVINLFAADTNPVAAGVPTIVRWDVSNAETVRIDPSIGAVAAAGNRSLILAVTTTLTLSATDSAGHPAQGQLTIVVK